MRGYVVSKTEVCTYFACVAKILTLSTALAVVYTHWQLHDCALAVVCLCTKKWWNDTGAAHAVLRFVPQQWGRYTPNSTCIIVCGFSVSSSPVIGNIKFCFRNNSTRFENKKLHACSFINFLETVVTPWLIWYALIMSKMKCVPPLLFVAKIFFASKIFVSFSYSYILLKILLAKFIKANYQKKSWTNCSAFEISSKEESN